MSLEKEREPLADKIFELSFLNLALIYALLAFLGASFASFITSFTQRFCFDLPLFKSRSFCFFCKNELKFYEIIPIFSFIFLKAKCKTCKNQIPFINFLAEIIGAFLLIFALNLSESLFNFIILALIFYIFLALSLFDFYLKAVPNFLLLALFLMTFIFKFSENILYDFFTFNENSFFLNAFLFAGFLFLLKSFIFIIKNLFSKKVEENLGDADIIILSSLAGMLGFFKAFVILFLACVLILLFLITLKIYNSKLKLSGAKIAFLPFISLAFVGYLLFLGLCYEAKF